VLLPMSCHLQPTLEATMAEDIAGVRIPDTPLARAVTDFVRQSTDELLYHHSRRVFLFGMLQGRHRGLVPDPELLYIGAMFHDLGLTDRFASTDRRFEVDSANAAKTFLRQHGIDDEAAAKVWLAIALHTTPGVPEYLELEIALVTAGVETDVLGIGYRDLSASDVAAVVAAHPRPNFKERILAAFTEGNRHRPRTTFGNVNADVLDHYDPTFVRDDFVDIILASDWPE
jgi:hypothetical protein